jgi:hypothetical protein
MAGDSRRDILNLLSNRDAELPDVEAAWQRAEEIISEPQEDGAPGSLAVCLLALLTQVIRPLFSKTQHPSLTSTGRKVLVSSSDPSGAGRFLSQLSDETVAEAWKSPITRHLLDYILHSYEDIPYRPPEVMSRRTTLAAHFHLLVPPILNMIDDAAPTPWKSAGCGFLRQLCILLVSTQSDMLRKSGLAEVFMDALKPNLLLLPTLTAEEDSLVVLGALYPASYLVADALCTRLKSPRLRPEDPYDSAHLEVLGDMTGRYQEMLKMIYREGVHASFVHLGHHSQSLSSSISPEITVLLLNQIPELFSRMGEHCVQHFQDLLPMLRVSLMDPFLVGHHPTLNAVFRVVECIIEVGHERIRDKWWFEILRGLIGCWLNCKDDQRAADARPHFVSRSTPDMQRVEGVVQALRDEVEPGEWEMVTSKLIEDEAELEHLFAARG